MSLFGSIMREFDHESFFSGQLDTMRRMENMMDNMMAPFGGMMNLGGFPRIGAVREVDQLNPFGNSLMPFGFGRSLFPNMNNIFSEVDSIAVNPNLHSYSSSSVMTYTTDEHGRPQVYQATSSTRSAPGGVKETRNSVQDSRSGLQKMAIGHHLGERAHIVEKERNRFTGEHIDNQEFINVDEDEADAFNQEWQEKARPPHNRRQRQQAAIGYSKEPELPAITSGPTIVEIIDSPEEEVQLAEPPIVNKPPRSSPSNSNLRKRDDAHHVHRSEGKHKRRHHAYGKMTSHRGGKSSRSRNENN